MFHALHISLCIHSTLFICVCDGLYLIGLPKDGAPLGVPQDDVRHAQVHQHLSAARKGAPQRGGERRSGGAGMTSWWFTLSAEEEEEATTSQEGQGRWF